MPILDTCLFSLEKNAAANLGIETQVYSMTDLETSSEEFLAASTNLEWDASAWDTYLSDLDNWASRPSLLEFVQTSD